ncbi:MAG TPA: hypothetical protein VHI13_04060 [Candidatus Kapabacteria bacterium]|nr:hypothetical protein [Candidatus Kapabacteria bacterium]
MHRRSVPASFFALLIMSMVAFAAFTGTAMAQVPIPNACCSFTVNAAGLPVGCTPFKLQTHWATGTQNNSIPGNGVFTIPITFAPCPPPPATFSWASLDGGITKAWFNFPATFHLGNCCYTVRIGTDANGCIVVFVRGC